MKFNKTRDLKVMQNRLKIVKMFLNKYNNPTEFAVVDTDGDGGVDFYTIGNRGLTQEDIIDCFKAIVVKHKGDLQYNIVKGELHLFY